IYPANKPSTSTSYNTPTLTVSLFKITSSTTFSATLFISSHSNDSIFSFLRSSLSIPRLSNILSINVFPINLHPFLPLPLKDISILQTHVYILYFLPFPLYTCCLHILQILHSQ